LKIKKKEREMERERAREIERECVPRYSVYSVLIG